MSVTAPGIKGVVTYFIGATPSVTVAFQAVSAPVPIHLLHQQRRGSRGEVEILIYASVLKSKTNSLLLYNSNRKIKTLYY